MTVLLSFLGLVACRATSSRSDKICHLTSVSELLSNFACPLSVYWLSLKGGAGSATNMIAYVTEISDMAHQSLRTMLLDAFLASVTCAVLKGVTTHISTGAGSSEPQRIVSAQ